MNETKVINNELVTKINQFKKKYTELLLQMDSSALLNLEKFENFENFNNIDNLNALLIENKTVANNLQLIKETIKKKIANLQLLSTKTSDDVNFYEQLFDFNVLNGIPNYYHGFIPSNQIAKIIEDIDVAMEKITQISDFIENKVIPKINEHQEENKSLTAMLNASQKEVETLLHEKEVDQNTINDLLVAIASKEKENNEMVDTLSGFNQKLIELGTLVDQNELIYQQASADKDLIINELENKINQLLNDLDSEQSFNFKDFNNLYKISDSFVGLINKLFTQSFNFVYETESYYFGKKRNFYRYRDILVQELNNSSDRYDVDVATINSLTANDIVEPSNDLTLYYTNQLKDVKTINDFINYLESNFINDFTNIIEVSNNLLTKLQSLADLKEDYFTVRNLKKINTFINQLSKYINNISDFKNQMIAFFGILTSYQNKVAFGMVNLVNYWANAAYGYNQILLKFKKEFYFISRIIELFFAYIYADKDNFNGVNWEFNQIFNEAKGEPNVAKKHKVYEDDLDAVNQFILETNANYNTYDYEHNQGMFEPIFIENQNLNQEMLDKIKPDYDQDLLLNELMNENKTVKPWFEKSDNKIKNEDFNQLFNSLQANSETIQRPPSDDITDEENETEIENQINDFVSFTKKIIRELEFKTSLDKAKKIIVKKHLYDVLVDGNTNIIIKLNEIESILYKTFGAEYFEQVFYLTIYEFKKYLLEKKYNVNLKLRVAKAKLKKIKTIMSLERDNNYLTLISNYQ